MASALKSKKIRSSMMIETLVALVILMIAFSFGIVIFMKVTTSGVSGKRMHATNRCKFLADSLIQVAERKDILLFQDGITYKVTFKPDPKTPEILIMNVVAEEKNGEQITKIQQLIQDHEKPKD